MAESRGCFGFDTGGVKRGSAMKNVCLKRKRRRRRKGEMELIGLILFLVGAVTVCVFLLPPQIWLIMIGFLLIGLGFFLFC